MIVSFFGKYKIINHRKYALLQRYPTMSQARAEASRWVKEPRISAKITGPEGRDAHYKVWVYDKSGDKKRRSK